MPRFEMDVDPVDHITAGAIGKPGQRIFYIQGWQGERTITVLVEKIQLQSLSVGMEKFLADIARENPDLPEASPDFNEDHMRIIPPVEPLIRVGEIGLGYDKEHDRIVLILRELLNEGEDAETASVIRFRCTRTQLRAMARWSAEVTQRGRPVCPQCSQPMEPEGHFCPKKNGHKH